MMRDVKGYGGLLALLLVLPAVGCDDENPGDAACPAGTVRSGGECVPSDAGVEGDAQPRMDRGPTDDGGRRDDGVDPDDGVPPGALPVAVDDIYVPSGYMGDGETGGIVETTDCPQRGGAGQGVCHRFVHTLGAAGWGGVWWQFPPENWGQEPGFPLPAGVTRLQFVAWSATGGEQLTFGVGYGPADGFAVELEVTLNTTPTTYSLDLAGVPYTDVAGGFSWVNQGAGGGVDFYVDDIHFRADPEDEIDLCTVSCATLRGLGDCAGVPGYGACQAQCQARRAGDCAAQADAWLACAGAAGWRCEADAPRPVNDCAASAAALAACEGDQAASLPFYIEDHFVMSGKMGGGEVEVGDCPAEVGGGACRAITWTPGDAGWVGFYFQHPENNWGELPGLAVMPGATHVRYRAWGASGGERAKFGVGIQDADGFQNESDFVALGLDPLEGFLPVPAGVVEITGGFAWYLENPAGAASVTFYLDDVEWRADAPPGGALGCTDPTASNYDPEAAQDDGACRYPITFRVDMNCTADAFAQVLISGPFCEWCAEGFPLLDPDGDGIYENTFEFPAGPLEYKYIVDGFAGQEDLIDDVAAGNGACAPVTDGATFANRQITVRGAAVQADTYGQCLACGVEPPPPLEGDFEAMTFEEPGRDYTLQGFGGSEDAAIEADPTDAGNRVLRITKADQAELWAGVTVSYGPNDTVQRLPFAAGSTRMTARVWSPDAGIQVRVKVEDATDPTVSVETEATTTLAGGWEVLTFDFAQQAPGTAALSLAATYNRLSVFPGFGVTGAQNGAAKTYYVDDITWLGGGGEDPPPVEGDVTFRVDMTCAGVAFNTVFITGPFCQWCAEGFPLADADGDGIWEGTWRFPAGPLEYKFMVDNFASQEDLVDDVRAGDGACAPITDGAGFANRQVLVAGDTVVNAVYGRCSACGEEPDPALEGDFTAITFEEPDRVYSLAGFGGAEDSAVEVDPTDPENTVLRITKADQAELWAGVTVSYGPDDTVQRLPFQAGGTRLQLRVWSPDAGIQIRVKVEDARDPRVTVEAEATTSLAGAWEVLVIDFAQQAPGTAALNPQATYNRLSVFASFGVTGAENGGARTYYVDDLEWLDGAGPGPEGFERMTFDDEGVEYGVRGFGGAENSAVEVDPTDASNRVVRLTKAGNAELWAGVAVWTGPNESVPRIPLAVGSTQMTLRVWSPDAGVPVRLKVENAADPGVSVETEAVTTLAEGWEVLVFDFAQQAPGTAAFNPGATYNKVAVFMNFGVPGADVGEKTYYFDDLTFVPGEGGGDPGDPVEGAFFQQGFDEAASAEGWQRVADAERMDAQLEWRAEAGNPGGALAISAQNTEEVGRAYIFQYNAAPTDFTGAPRVRLSFDARTVGPLVATAFHLQTNLPGVGVTNHFDLQAVGLNADGWTRFQFDYAGVAPGEAGWFVHFNFAAGALIDAGGTVLIDNLTLAPLPGN